MNKTKIEWAKNPGGTPGYTWNPITGCLNGCEYCYARRLANTRLKERYLANKNVAPVQVERIDDHAYSNPFYPRLWEWRILEPRDSSRGKGIFVCDMSDLFGIGIPEEWTKRVLKEIPICHDNRFYLLTKQPQNLIKFSPFPDNCWVGVTATNPQMFHEAEVHLSQISATIKYISIEPMLEQFWTGAVFYVDWVIIGAQTKPYKPPKIEWVQEIVEAAGKAGIPVFLKDNLAPLIKGVKGKNFYLRQELPGDNQNPQP